MGWIVLKKSLSAMFDFLGGLRARHSKISWGTSQFFDCAACEVLSGSEMVLSGNVPSDSNLASFRRARFFDFFNEIAPKRPSTTGSRNAWVGWRADFQCPSRPPPTERPSDPTALFDTCAIKSSVLERKSLRSGEVLALW